MFEVKPRFSRNRSRRVRKKLNLDEFQVLGFRFGFVAQDKSDEAILDFVCDWAAVNKMLVACSTVQGRFEGYIAQAVPMAARSENMVFHNWCESNGFSEIDVSGFWDANYLS